MQLQFQVTQRGQLCTQAVQHGRHVQFIEPVLYFYADAVKLWEPAEGAGQGQAGREAR